MQCQSNATESWKDLLGLALPALKQLPKEIEWDLGGGTALMLFIKHRISKDVDIFFENARALKLLAPSANVLTKKICDDWQQPGHYIKLIKYGKGEIDFLVSRTFEDNPNIAYDFIYNNQKQPIRVETPKEILSRKIFHRASQFTIRDIFDTASVIEYDPKILTSLSLDVVEKLPLAINRVKTLQNEYTKEILNYIIPLNIQEHILKDAPEMAIEMFSRELARANRRERFKDTKLGF